MKESSETIEILNDLIRINNDRVVGYERAMKELSEEDEDLKTLFASFIDQSRNIKNELGYEVQALGGTIESGTTNMGKIYRAWMDVRAVFTGHDRHAVLANCERGEDAAQTAYTEALSSGKLPAYLGEMIAEQQKWLRNSHDEIKAQRDQYA